MQEAKSSVLLVDDNINLTKSMSLILNHKGFDVDSACDGLDALEKVKEKSFDIIFLDIKMPHIDGVETYKRIKEIRPYTVVIMMTAYSVEEMVQEAIKEGVHGIIYKPFVVKDVISHIKTATEKKKVGLILIVEDDPGTSSTLKRILSKEGYTVAVCTNGDDAITTALENNFNALFIDMKLPTINGSETYLAIKKVKPNIVVVMMTGYRQEFSDLVSEALDNSAYTCLYKPLQMSQVLQLIEEILRRKMSTND